ncbi:DUF397 domain-containing protein [Streptomyces sodiiphilus]|uniref:DUF397 domain-containing protein n=1 Tax=Streptomyces sodiiphilus TaxID=226217 RepID=UPI0031CED124
MSTLPESADWQKSSYSSQGNNCVELSADGSGRVLLRESEAPGTVLASGPERLRALLTLASNVNL